LEFKENILSDYFKKIMIVSDSSILVNELGYLLKERRREITTTDYGGMQLMERLKSDAPDLTIFDSSEISGRDIAQLIYIRHSLDIPVILISSSKIQQKVVEIIHFEERSLLNKSISLGDLIVLIEGILTLEESN
jgi:DNA-binding NtrC family response regulator